MISPSPKRLLLSTTMCVALAGIGVACTSESSPEGRPSGSESSELAGDSPAAQAEWKAGRATHGQVVSDDVRVRMDDGVILDAEVRFPSDLSTGERSPGTFPVIVNITPYTSDLEPYAAAHGKFFTERGYIFASVSIRGTQESGGKLGMFSARDAADGAAIVEWAARELEGSNGTVGGYGCSYPGMAMIATAGTVGTDSPLKAIIPACTGWDFLREMSLVGGIPTGDSVLYDLMPQFVGDQPSARAAFGAVADDMRTGGPTAYDGRFWQARQPIRYAERIVENDIPTLLWTGWNDVNRRGALEMYAALQNAAAGAESTGPFLSDSASPKYQVIVGPWHHTQGLDPAVMLEWYDTWLQGEETPIGTTEQPLHLYELGSERFINATSYPLDADYDTLYLGPNSSLASDVPTTRRHESIAWSQPSRPDGVLEYTTAPFSNGATLAGPSSAEVFARTSTTNLELIASLYDVAPDGTEKLITFGVVLGSQSDLDPDRSWRDPKGTPVRPYTTQLRDTYLTPGRTQKFSIALHPHLWSIEPGHALRLRFTTQASAEDCSVDGGVGVLLPCRPTRPQRASLAGGVYEIEWSARSPSAVHLPLLDHGCFATARARATSRSGGAVIPVEWTSPANSC